MKRRQEPVAPRRATTTLPLLGLKSKATIMASLREGICLACCRHLAGRTGRCGTRRSAGRMPQHVWHHLQATAKHIPARPAGILQHLAVDCGPGRSAVRWWQCQDTPVANVSRTLDLSLFGASHNLLGGVKEIPPWMFDTDS